MLGLQAALLRPPLTPRPRGRAGARRARVHARGGERWHGLWKERVRAGVGTHQTRTAADETTRRPRPPWPAASREAPACAQAAREASVAFARSH